MNVTVIHLIINNITVMILISYFSLKKIKIFYNLSFTFHRVANNTEVTSPTFCSQGSHPHYNVELFESLKRLYLQRSKNVSEIWQRCQQTGVTCQQLAYIYLPKKKGKMREVNERTKACQVLELHCTVNRCPRLTQLQKLIRIPPDTPNMGDNSACLPITPSYRHQLIRYENNALALYII